MPKNIDPIVLPGLYKSHMHSFYGSDVVTKTLPTTEELQKGCPSGENPNDLSVHWAPTLYHVDGDNYTEVNPVMFSTYYENIDKAEIPFPNDFYADDIDERINGITWLPRAALPQVTCSTHIQAILRFTNCVNVQDIKKHAYAAANGGRCPADMKSTLQLRFSIRYDVRKLIPEGWSGPPPLKLACGANLLKATSGRRFMRIDGARGEGKAGSSCTPQDADPGNGTSDYK
ncbi:hypothetical protein B0T24DRAFT_649080 [Lasiosphaeria ovina]|uniref:DUF1996 domain-containing protein n=1 Tax=Lasiosphaeria ovina TaxID=92902 RepID=A0AAE0KB24_9PEZI|nr:hypothetical protein B0T24DRAFT_649080 [Lasiosphaeria ovina]